MLTSARAWRRCGSVYDTNVMIQMGNSMGLANTAGHAKSRRPCRWRGKHRRRSCAACATSRLGARTRPPRPATRYVARQSARDVGLIKSLTKVNLTTVPCRTAGATMVGQTGTSLRRKQQPRHYSHSFRVSHTTPQSIRAVVPGGEEERVDAADLHAGLFAAAALGDRTRRAR